MSVWFMLRRILQQFPHYLKLMRLHRPIGIFLLLWPTLWALWLAQKSSPTFKIFMIFFCGVIVMRSLGCIINDFADRHFDAQVARTQDRPLAKGIVSVKEALMLALILALIAFALVLQCNFNTVLLACIAATFTVGYPFLKRFTHLPQLGLGIVFNWGIPMAFAAENTSLDIRVWLLFSASLIWTFCYDTLYAISDRTDDIKIGVKSSAILLKDNESFVIAFLQGSFIVLMGLIGYLYQLHPAYYVVLPLVALLFAYQHWLIRERSPKYCIEAFNNNNWVGLTLFAGILMGLYA